jgi:hypothetical protein
VVAGRADVLAAFPGVEGTVGPLEFAVFAHDIICNQLTLGDTNGWPKL